MQRYIGNGGSLAKVELEADKSNLILQQTLFTCRRQILTKFPILGAALLEMVERPPDLEIEGKLKTEGTGEIEASVEQSQFDKNVVGSCELK